jgi:hypothetical protein
MLERDELRHTILLIYANKQDLPNALGAEEITQRLGLNELRHRQWTVQPCSATTGEGLYEGLDWLTSALREQPSFLKRVEENRADEAAAAAAPAPAPGGPAIPAAPNAFHP